MFAHLWRIMSKFDDVSWVFLGSFLIDDYIPKLFRNLFQWLNGRIPFGLWWWWFLGLSPSFPTSYWLCFRVDLLGRAFATCFSRKMAALHWLCQLVRHITGFGWTDWHGDEWQLRCLGRITAPLAQDLESFSSLSHDQGFSLIQWLADAGKSLQVLLIFLVLVHGDAGDVHDDGCFAHGELCARLFGRAWAWPCRQRVGLDALWHRNLLERIHSWFCSWFSRSPCLLARNVGYLGAGVSNRMHIDG